VDASTDGSIQQSFTQFARMLQVDGNIESVKRTLANTSQAWLLVFDNADDPNLKLTPYLPTSSLQAAILNVNTTTRWGINKLGNCL
jgi:hypothetical protein